MFILYQLLGVTFLQHYGVGMSGNSETGYRARAHWCNIMLSATDGFYNQNRNEPEAAESCLRSEPDIARVVELEERGMRQSLRMLQAAGRVRAASNAFK